MSRLCPGLPDFAALSRNPARLHKWRCGTSINSVYFRISVRISRCLVGVAVHNRPKVGVVSQKWAWSVKFRARFARINYIFYSVPVSLLVNLATMPSFPSVTSSRPVPLTISISDTFWEDLRKTQNSRLGRSYDFHAREVATRVFIETCTVAIIES